MGALPKRRLTRSRSRARRHATRARRPNLGRCATCGSLVTSHRVCPVCGNYRGVPVTEPTGRASKYR
ncbi:MAG: 50S ribosomal protein L32 [Chloroflexi bacterium]|nr:50S ribosomal protein L32 [Chloroflexota bacterium]